MIVSIGWRVALLISPWAPMCRWKAWLGWKRQGASLSYLAVGADHCLGLLHCSPPHYYSFFTRLILAILHDGLQVVFQRVKNIAWKAFWDLLLKIALYFFHISIGQSQFRFMLWKLTPSLDRVWLVLQPNTPCLLGHPKGMYRSRRYRWSRRASFFSLATLFLHFLNTSISGCMVTYNIFLF